MRPVLLQLIEEMSLQQHVFLAGGSSSPLMYVPNPDLFLMGSYYEGFPNAMLEAIAAGIPTIAFNAPGGIAELLVNNQNGILVEGNDESEFAAAIEKALNHPFDKKKIQESTLQRFNINAIMQQWYNIFDSLK